MGILEGVSFQFTDILETLNKEFQNLLPGEGRKSKNEDENHKDVVTREEEKLTQQTIEEKEGVSREEWTVKDEFNSYEWTTVDHAVGENGNGEGTNWVVDPIWDDDRSKRTYPSRPGETGCAFYLRTGTCGFGSNCKFNHPQYKFEENAESPKKIGRVECKYYLTAEGCQFGEACKYQHPREKPVFEVKRPVKLNFLDLPIRPGEPECPFYMRTGSCKFATNCWYNHPDPTPIGSDSGYARSSSVPSHTASKLQSFMSMPQPYQVTVKSVCSGEGNARPVDQYPERPGQKECQHYMTTGDCKYKSACWFHHPKDRFLKPPTLSRLGLPLRPDQIVCKHFSRYGICKYGAACIYDHTPPPVAVCTGPVSYYHNGEGANMAATKLSSFRISIESHHMTNVRVRS